MGEKTHTSKSNEVKRTNEKVDLRKHKKRLTTFTEKQFIMETRKKYKQEDLRKKMEKISKDQKKEDDFGSSLKEDDTKKKNSKLNCIGFPHDDPYGLSEAWWTIFTKPKVK
jgi:mannitol-specific phosphotransferase system IIBC component